MADAHYGIGYVCRKTNQLNKALDNYSKSLEYYKKVDDLSGIGKTYIAMGSTMMYKGEYGNSIKLFHKALDMFESLGNKYETVRVYNNIGAVYGRSRDIDNAIKYYEKQIKLAEGIGYVELLAYGLSNLSLSYGEKGDADRATIYIEKALPMVKKLGDKYVIANTYANLGCILYLKKDWKGSIKSFNESVRIGKEIKSLDSLSMTYLDFAKMYKSKGDNINAKKQFENALKCYEKLGNKEKIKEIKNELLELEKGLRKCQKTRIKRKVLKS